MENLKTENEENDNDNRLKTEAEHKMSFDLPWCFVVSQQFYLCH